MPKLGETFKQGDSPKQIVNLLYNTGYRLTGSHKETEELVKGVFDALNGNSNLNTALNNMCLMYMNKTTSGSGKNSLKDKSSTPTKGNSTNKIQEALLTLQPAERLVLVLREILGLSYSEIAEMTGIEKMAVTRLLNTGRWALRKHLVPPPGKSRLPKNTVVK
ncbi:RNA polymerase sigma factor [Desulfoscipio geothermicus]|uniref:RNA polymerase sigma-70 factor, ECF subfamily n=1 Tax=Desulfoscipio geothermicus DSM 3669 TaxID=1121426 RepID=A0A1I6D514_9FIRM|nr:sigma-70 family RNA polymerase sigma factor [Desulfoscipio geothermicus]SFR00586.1 RNA polymerase sigma-70 factor, ECF subfamily [Desulfoscipio geothermicus DSM 3669]